MSKNGNLINYKTNHRIRKATRAELIASVRATRYDSGAGVISVDGIDCYVYGEEVHCTDKELQ